MPQLTTESGKPVDLGDDTGRDQANQTFASAMAASTEDKTPPAKAAPAAEGAAPRKRRGRPPKTEQARTAPKAAATTLSDADRRTGVLGLAQLGAGLALAVASTTKSEAFHADAIVISSSAEQLADACAATAAANPGFARTLDKICAVGPNAALVTVMVGIGMQIARNHQPSLHLPGTSAPADIVRVALAEAEGQAPEQDAPLAA
jgi:hypothetical protein